MAIEPTLRRFGEGLEHARRAYAHSVALGDDADSIDAYLGDQAFVRRHVKDSGPSTEFPYAQRRPNIAALDHLLTTRTDAAINRAYRDGYRIRQIAAALGLHYSTVSRRITSFERSPAQKELLQRKT